MHLAYSFDGPKLLGTGGAIQRALPLLDDVCGLRETAGQMVGNLACEMADRARRGECFEDYHGGFVDVTTAKPPVKATTLPNAPTATDKVDPAKPSAPLPPMARVINLAARRKKMRRSAVAAVRWAIGEDFATNEVEGSIIKVLHKRPELVEDQDALYRECLTVLRQATCQ